MEHRSLFRTEELRPRFPSCTGATLAAGPRSESVLLLPPPPISTPITHFGYLPPQTEMQRTGRICSPPSYLTVFRYQAPNIVDKHKTLLPYPSRSLFASTLYSRCVTTSNLAIV